MEDCRKVRSETDDACRRTGRQPSEVRLLPVSKAVPADTPVKSWPEFAAAGCVGLTEGRAQEAVAKTETFRDAFGDKASYMAIIGPLQMNKADHLVSCAGKFQASDRPKVAGALQHRLADSKHAFSALIQVNASRGPRKSGLASGYTAEFVRMFGPDGEYPNLRLHGLTTIAVQNDPNVCGTFTEPRELRDSLLRDSPKGVSLGELSMGMSGSYHEAIAEGAITMCVGCAIFGERSHQK